MKLAAFYIFFPAMQFLFTSGWTPKLRSQGVEGRKLRAHFSKVTVLKLAITAKSE